MRPRTHALIFLVSCVACAANAEDLSKDIDIRLQTRNVNVAPTLFQNKTFLAESTFGGTHNAHVGSFYFIDHTRTKEFSTHPLYGMNKYWAGDFKYDSKAANLGDRVVPNATKAVETKTSDTKAASESDKQSQSADRSFLGNTSEYRARGKSQDRLDKGGPDSLRGPVPLGLQGDMHQMTLDEVRTLLNKNK